MPEAQRHWFHDPIRLVHTILRSKDAPGYDAQAYVDYATRLNGNTIVINGGGLYAFYPSKVTLHRRVPGLDTDVVADVVEAAHERGLRVLARVDFRGGHPEAFDAHPEWFSYDVNGEPVIANGFHSAPVTSPYRNEAYGFEIVRELMQNYDLDGIWENAPGFAMPGGGGRAPVGPTAQVDRLGAEAASFDLVDYGPCTRRRFAADTGLELPTPDAFDPDVYRTYLRWRYQVMREHAEAFRNLVKSYGADKAYVAEFPAMLDVNWGRSNGQDTAEIAPLWDIVTAPSFDILRGSFGSNLYPTPVWRAEESAKFLGAANANVPPTVLFGRFDNQSRYTTVGRDEMKVWLAGSLAHGAGFWECTFVGRHGGEFLDRRNEDVVEEYYGLLDEHKEYFRDARPVADVAVVHSHRTQDYFGSDDPRADGYVQHVRGVFATLFAEHVPFDIVPDAHLDASTLERYRVLVLPNTALLSEQQCAALRRYVEGGGAIVATFETSLYTEDGDAREDYALADVFGAASTGLVTPNLPFAYTLIRTRDEFTAKLDDTSVCTNTGRVRVVRPVENARVPATLVREVRPQPPEHGWRAEWESDVPVVVGHEFGAGRSVLFPGQTDKLAVESGHPDYGQLLVNAIDWAGRGERLLETDAPDSVHVSVTGQPSTDRRLVHFVNYTGGPHRPIRQIVPVRDLTVELRVANAPARVRTLRTGVDLSFEQRGDRVRFTLPTLDVYEAVIVE